MALDVILLGETRHYITLLNFIFLAALNFINDIVLSMIRSHMLLIGVQVFITSKLKRCTEGEDFQDM